jgi:hypothetical protein
MLLMIDLTGSTEALKISGLEISLSLQTILIVAVVETLAGKGFARKSRSGPTLVE